MSKTPDKRDVSKIIVSMADGSTWEAIWDENGLKLIKEIDPPTGSSGDPFQDLLEEFEQEQESKDNEAAEDQETEQPPEEGGEEPEEQPQAPGQGAGGSPPPPKVIPPSELEPVSDSAFKSRLMSIMRDNMYDRRSPNKSRGKLDMKRLFRVKTGATNVFTQKESKKNKNYSVVLCVDNSGSMSDYRKSTVAADSTALLVKTLQLAGIHTAVVSFGVGVYVLKDFNTHADKKMLGLIHANISSTTGSTPQFDAMLVGYKLLAGREGKKLMIVMADGDCDMPPSFRLQINAPIMKTDGTYRKDPLTVFTEDWAKEYNVFIKAYNDGRIRGDEFARKAVVARFHDLIKKNKDVDTVGVGIIDPSVADTIPDSKIIKSVEELKPVIVHEIKKRVRRS